MKRAHVIKVEACREPAYPGAGENAYRATDSAGRSFTARTEKEAREMAEDYNRPPGGRGRDGANRS